MKQRIAAPARRLPEYVEVSYLRIIRLWLSSIINSQNSVYEQLYIL